jgi:hypothetical protein
MVSIWMLRASRTPGNEPHKALRAGPRPRAPMGPPARPQRQSLRAVRLGPPENLRLERLSSRGTTQPPQSWPKAFASPRRGLRPNPGVWQVLHRLAAKKACTFVPFPELRAHPPTHLCGTRWRPASPEHMGLALKTLLNLCEWSRAGC